MRNLRLRVVEDEEYGGLGLKFVVPHKLCNGRFTIQTGLVLAHDVIEHQQGHQKIGSIGDEMVALGGICYARGQWGDVDNSHYSAEQSIASEITGQMANLYLDQGIPFRQKLQRSRKSDPTAFVDYVIEEARSSWTTVFEVWDNDQRHSQERIDSYLEACRIYMLHGAKLAERRFGSGILANEMFNQIKDTTETQISNLEFEGQEFILGYDFNKNIRFNEVQDDLHWDW